ncbi:S53 family peptidase [Undibacterium umbellatum]|uniref:S53 family peptidase n=1 Tax=Undibacterium umbellatum TaxID=2762300 RepID=A0ABR6Z775_9BURK|nr:S53 family peptidase [Undibacterium umbellatum]MBC3907454.1 S53 family peptidase [Undibacterium umbellatum]
MIIIRKIQFNLLMPRAWLGFIFITGVLSACGGDSSQISKSNIASPPAEIATGISTLAATLAVLPTDIAMPDAQPTFHLAPVLLDPPADMDMMDASQSARMLVAVQAVPHDVQRVHGVLGRGLTVSAIRSLPRQQFAPVPATDTVLPMAGTAQVLTYTPAQIRAAYGLPALPDGMSKLSATQAAQFGAGQTIYIVNARHDPNILAELNAFNQKFGLPACSVKNIPVTTSLPLPAASASACEFSVVYSTSAGGMSSTVPAYDAGWATEIALDVQWAHATAPLARIILIEAADASMSNMVGGIRLANAMGPGVVSMSFGASEGSWTASVENTFTTAKMTYLAASGDNGPAVEWPAVSPNVVAVGGTSLTYAGSARTEVAWSNTGGGVSAYTATPAYQTNDIPGLGTPVRRAVADVSMNADPNTGQYVAIITPGSSTVSWVSAGGTSLATPQWAGIIAIANATLVQAGKPVMGAPHAVLYNKIASVPGTYASAFVDIAKGSNGACTSCSATTGHDLLTGLGTPNVSNLLSALSASSGIPANTSTNTAPVVSPASINAEVGTVLSFTVSATASNPLAYTLSGNPAGMNISNAGIVTWTTPLAGTYAVTVTALDAKTGLSGKAVYTIIITTAVPPVVTAASINGLAGTALSYQVFAITSNSASYSLAGAPTGMNINSAGTINWAKPLAGKYLITVNAKDSKTGLSSQAVISLTVTAAGMSINAPPMVGVAGKSMTGNISITAPGASSVSVSIAGAPLGLSFSMSGLNITSSWAKPVAGSFTMKITANDNAGRTAVARMLINIAAK